MEIKMGMIDRGADLSVFSQYPHEKEICFPPLTGIEVMSTAVDYDRASDREAPQDAEGHVR